MNKWLNEVLLPSLFTKYQARNPKYETIIISDRQAAYIREEMREKRACCTMNWDTREVVLVCRGQYNMLCFGPSNAELVERQTQARQAAWDKEIERAERQKRNGRINPYFVRDLKSELENLTATLHDVDNPYTDSDAQRIEHIKKVLAILA